MAIGRVYGAGTYGAGTYGGGSRMTTTQANLLDGFSRLLADYFASTTTSAGAVGGTTVVDTALTPSPDNAFAGRYVRVPGIVTEAAKNRVITASAQSTGALTVAPAFGSQIGSGTAYQLHRFAPTLKLEALNDARAVVFERTFVHQEDTSLSVTTGQYAYAIPAELGVVRQVWVQQQAMPADFPYLLLPVGEGWDLVEDALAGTRTLRLPVWVVGGYAGMKLRVVAVEPLSVVSLDSDVMEIAEADDLRLLYLAAAEILFGRLANIAAAQDADRYRAEAVRWGERAAKASEEYRRSWPVSL